MTVLYSYFEQGKFCYHEHVMYYVEAFDLLTEKLAEDGTTVFFGVFHD